MSSSDTIESPGARDMPDWSAGWRPSGSTIMTDTRFTKRDLDSGRSPRTPNPVDEQLKRSCMYDPAPPKRGYLSQYMDKTAAKSKESGSPKLSLSEIAANRLYRNEYERQRVSANEETPQQSINTSKYKEICQTCDEYQDYKSRSQLLQNVEQLIQNESVRAQVREGNSMSRRATDSQEQREPIVLSRAGMKEAFGKPGQATYLDKVEYQLDKSGTLRARNTNNRRMQSEKPYSNILEDKLEEINNHLTTEESYSSSTVDSIDDNYKKFEQICASRVIKSPEQKPLLMTPSPPKPAVEPESPVPKFGKTQSEDKEQKQSEFATTRTFQMKFSPNGINMTARVKVPTCIDLEEMKKTMIEKQGDFDEITNVQVVPPYLDELNGPLICREREMYYKKLNSDRAKRPKDFSNRDIPMDADRKSVISREVPTYVRQQEQMQLRTMKEIKRPELVYQEEQPGNSAHASNSHQNITLENTEKGSFVITNSLSVKTQMSRNYNPQDSIESNEEEMEHKDSVTNSFNTSTPSSPSSSNKEEEPLPLPAASQDKEEHSPEAEEAKEQTSSPSHSLIQDTSSSHSVTDNDMFTNVIVSPVHSPIIIPEGIHETPLRNSMTTSVHVEQEPISSSSNGNIFQTSSSTSSVALSANYDEPQEVVITHQVKYTKSGSSTSKSEEEEEKEKLATKEPVVINVQTPKQQEAEEEAHEHSQGYKEYSVRREPSAMPQTKSETTAKPEESSSVDQKELEDAEKQLYEGVRMTKVSTKNKDIKRFFRIIVEEDDSGKRKLYMVHKPGKRGLDKVKPTHDDLIKGARTLIAKDQTVNLVIKLAGRELKLVNVEKTLAKALFNVITEYAEARKHN